MILLQSLPSQFDRAKYIEVAAQLQIPESIAKKQIARFLSAGLSRNDRYATEFVWNQTQIDMKKTKHFLPKNCQKNIFGGSKS